MLSSSRLRAIAGGDGVDDAFSIARHADDGGGGHGVEVVEPDEEEAGHAGNDAAFVQRIAVGFKNGQVNPRKARFVAGAPDDVLDVEGAAVG